MLESARAVLGGCWAHALACGRALRAWRTFGRRSVTTARAVSPSRISSRGSTPIPDSAYYERLLGPGVEYPGQLQGFAVGRWQVVGRNSGFRTGARTRSAIGFQADDVDRPLVAARRFGQAFAERCGGPQRGGRCRGLAPPAESKSGGRVGRRTVGVLEAAGSNGASYRREIGSRFPDQ